MIDSLKPGLDAIKLAGEIIGTIASVKQKLTAQPEPAAHELALALDEVHKTFLAISAELSRYLGLAATLEALRSGAPILAELEGTSLYSRVDAARGSCHVIKNIYHKHLDRWFRGALTPEEFSEIRGAFASLEQADQDLFAQMCAVCRVIADEAAEVYDLVLEEEWGQARAKIVATRKEWREVEKAMAGPMSQLSTLKNEFITVSGVTNPR